MPTSLPRIQVTATPRVVDAIEAAERVWPGVPRSELITRLLAEGADALAQAQAERGAHRRRLLERTRGSIDYPDGYLDELREDWPQ